MPKRLLVIGGTKQQFNDYCKSKRIKPNKVVHCQRWLDLPRNFDAYKVRALRWHKQSMTAPAYLEMEAMLNRLHALRVKWKYVK